MTELKIEGTIIQEFPEKTGVGAKGNWRVKEFLISYGDKYPKEVIVQAWNDMIEKVGEQMGKVTFHIEVTSKKTEKGYYNTTAKVWKVS